MPLIVWNDKNLTPTEKILMTDIIGLIKTGKKCFKSNQAFSDLIGLSKDRASKILSDLAKRGYIKVNFERKSSSNVDRRIITLSTDFRKSLLGGLAFEESSTDTELTDEDRGGIGVHAEGYSYQQLGGIGVHAEEKKSIEEVNEEVLNINAETSSADVKDLFGNEVKLANGIKPKQAKKKKVSTANPAHQMIKKFWYEEFSKGERWNSGSGTFINEIILNINSLISERGGEVSPEITFDFFKTICNQKKMSKSSFVYSAGLSTLSSPNHFKSIIEIIEKENGQQQFNQRGHRAGVTDFRFNVSDPRIKQG